MIVRVHYTDGDAEDYPDPIAAEQGILSRFADSDNQVLPDAVEEIDEDGLTHLADMGVTWRVTVDYLHRAPAKGLKDR